MKNQGLAPVRIPGTIRRQGVNPNQIKRGVPLTIEPYLNMAAGDAVTLRWGDVRMDLPAVTASEVGQPINIWVPPQIILEAGEDLRLEVTYCILDRVGNNSHWAPPRTLKIGCANPYLKNRRKKPSWRPNRTAKGLDTGDTFCEGRFCGRGSLLPLGLWEQSLLAKQAPRFCKTASRPSRASLAPT
nr:hypothetical protein GCM10020185_28800 [Pseudomonas brassicacearum subsp. brassicacearum]